MAWRTCKKCGAHNQGDRGDCNCGGVRIDMLGLLCLLVAAATMTIFGFWRVS